MPTSDHFAAAALAHLSAAKGVRHVVISPGSRNAPLVIAFHHQRAIRCLTVIDERSAAFIALGLAQQTASPVAMICTSGSAVLNYGPAVAEAFYQRIPLLVITADRPEEWVDQGEGQAIRQRDVLKAHMKASFQMPREPHDALARWQCTRMINEAIDACTGAAAGPVHVNVPFDEPLYGLVDRVPDATAIHAVPARSWIDADRSAELSERLHEAPRVLILAGQGPGGTHLLEPLRTLAASPTCAVLTEATSNLDHPDFITCIDRTIEGITAQDAAQMKPSLLITFGGAVVSKRIKTLLRAWRPAEHWNIDPAQRHHDTYQCLTHDIAMEPGDFFTAMNMRRADGNPAGTGRYGNAWRMMSDRARSVHDRTLADAPFCDLTVFRALLDRIPGESDVHLANSTPARYIQLFDRSRGLRFFGNRGASGIDGCVSTAVGAAFATGKTTTLICGDIAFAYDSNAFWNEFRPARLRVIVVDNGGGNIFRFIPGPDEHPGLLPYFETPHGRDIKGLVGSYGLPYAEAFDMPSLEHGLHWLYEDHGVPAVLHVRTDAEISPKVLRGYFRDLRGE